MRKILLTTISLLYVALFTYADNENVDGQGVSVSGKEGLYTYVDLGLKSGTKWATHNVGATNPTEYGDYFAWGETETKEKYTLDTYKLCKGTDDSMTKYCTLKKWGTVDNKKMLEADDDAATANWGSAWRMPTVKEIEELMNGCDWKWVEDFNGSGVYGQLGTSKTNGKTIFLPAAGSFGTGPGYVNFYCNYWSSSLDVKFPGLSSILSFGDGNIHCSIDDRSNGNSVRAVLR